MKRSETPTAYILLKAETNSEWETCDFVLIRITPEWLRLMQHRLDTVEQFKDDLSFCHLTYAGSPEGFYCSPTDGSSSLPDEILQAGEQWAFVTIEDGEPDALSAPETELNCYRVYVHKDGTAQFIVSGEYTNEEFWTEGFDVAALITAAQKETIITEH